VLVERHLQLGHPVLHLHLALLVSTAPPTGDVPDRPALAPWCRVVEDGDRLFAEHGGTLVTFEGRGVTTLLPRLLPLLDGTRTVEQIKTALGSAAAPAVARALGLLSTNRLLVEGPHGASDGGTMAVAASFAAAVTRRTTEQDALAALEAAQVSVLGAGRAAAEIRRQLRSMGIGSVTANGLDADPDGSFLVAVPGPDEQSLLPALNAATLERRLTWMQVLPFDGRVVIVGPVFVPGRTACRECYVLRRAACSGYEDDFDVVEGTATRAASPPPLTTLAASLAALLALRWLTAGDPALPGRLYALEVGAVLRLSHDHVLRVPRCPQCGTPERSVPSPWFEGAA
jgi:bacteriocin biosynthesis cyclodehydratase domain-containing protein